MAGLSERMRQMVRPELKDFEPYDPAFVPCDINLSANENTWPAPAGLSAAVREALATVPLNRYPDPLANELRDAIAAWHGVERENVLVGDGGDELLFLLFLAFGGPGRVLVDCPPSFTVYGLYASMVGTTVEQVWRDPETMLPDLEALVDAGRRADLVAVTSPNNPTGDAIARGDIERLLDACPGIVLVDEAYGEFSEAGTALPLLRTHDNVVVLHTLSKAFGMAGVRLGYLLGPADVVDALSAVRQPYSVGVLPQAAALAAVEHRDDALAQIAAIREERERLRAGLLGLGLTVWPSDANFLLVRVPDAHEVRARLATDFSILVRDFSQAPGLADCLRITVGTPEEDDAVIRALAALVGKERP